MFYELSLLIRFKWDAESCPLTSSFGCKDHKGFCAPGLCIPRLQTAYPENLISALRMNLVNKNGQPFKYIYLLQPDGIGTQFIYISRLLDYAIETGCRVIVDFRKMAFFLGWGSSFEETALSKVFFFDTDRIITSPAKIDSILSEHPEQVISTRFCQEKFNLTNMPAYFVWANDLLSVIKVKHSSCCLKGKLKLKGEYIKTFHKYQQVASSCVGVHARFGNGEQHIGNGRDRMKISWDRFFTAIDACKDDPFFVCTDTPSFLEACKNKYGGRIISIDRFRPPENCGPGHNTWSIYDNEKKTGYIKERNRAGPYRLLGEALVEMFLLGECKRLICNNSAFTHYARACCQVDALMLE